MRKCPKRKLTSKGFQESDAWNLLQRSLRRKDKQSAHGATKILLQNDQLRWHHIVDILFADHCMSDTEVLKFVFDRYQRGGKQDMFECIDMMLTSCKTCIVAKCLTFSADCHLPSMDDGEKWSKPPPRDESLEGLMDEALGCVDVQLVLRQLLRAWDEEYWHGVIQCIFMTLVVTLLESKRDVTGKGEDYLLPKPSDVRSHFTLIVLTALYRATLDQDTKNYILACYNLATIKGTSLVYSGFLLFSIVTRCMNKAKVVPFALSEKSPIWEEVAHCTEISLSHGEEDEHRDSVDMTNPYLEHFQKLNMTDGMMHINLKMCMQQYRRSGCHNLLSVREYLCLPKHKKRKSKEHEMEPPAKRFKIVSDVGGKVIAKGPYLRNPYMMSRILFSNDCLRSALDDEHAIKVYKEGNYLMASYGTSEMMHIHRMTDFGGFPATFWVHLVYKYALELGDLTLPNGLVVKCSVPQSFGIDMMSSKCPSSLIDVMVSTAVKGKIAHSILRAVKKCKMEILGLLHRDLRFTEMTALSKVHGVYFDEPLFKERIQQCIGMLKVL